MLIGYMRPYHGDETCDLQLKQLSALNCKKIYQEEHTSAKRRNSLNQMINDLNHGDQIIVTKLFALADSTRHLVEMLDEIEQNGASIRFLKEGINTNNNSNFHFNTVVKYLVQFQSDVISENTKRGLQKAKEKGITTGRPKKPDENVQRAIIMYESKKYSLKEITEATGISKSTLYRYMEN